MAGAESQSLRPGYHFRDCERCCSKFQCETGRGKVRKYCDQCKLCVVSENRKNWSSRNQDKEKQIKSAYKKLPHVRQVERQRNTAWRTTDAGKAKVRQTLRLRYGALRNAANILRIDPQAKAEVDALYRQACSSGMTVDHIYPLKHELVCGLHVPWNLRIVTLEENSRKRNKLPHEVGLILE